MRGGGLVQALHHAFDPSLLIKSNLKSSDASHKLSSFSVPFFSCYYRTHSTSRVYGLCLRCPNSICGFSNDLKLENSGARCVTFSTSRPSRTARGCDYALNLTGKLPRQSNRSVSDLKSGGLGSGVNQTRSALAAIAPTMDGPPEGYRPNVGVCLVNEKNEIFVASRLDVPESWQMPQGGVDDGEEPRNAAIRELREETGVTSAELIGEVHEWLTYDFPPDVKEKITRLWKREWTGQAQKWFLFRFTGDETEVDLAGDGTEPAEFGNWKWLPAAEVVKGAVEFKKPVYAQAFKSLSVYVESWSKL